MTATTTPPPPTYRLPPEAYSDPAWYEHEQRALFGRTWILVAHVSELRGPADTAAGRIAGEQVVVARGGDGALQAWRTVDGARVSVAVGVLHGFVFANLAAAVAEPFADWLGEYPEHTGDYPWADLVEIRRVRVPIACNWKLYVENHVDWLHLWYLHADSLAMYEHHTAEHATTGWHWWSAELLRPGEEPFLPEGLRPIPGVGDAELDTLRATFVFPNLPVSSRGALVTTYQVVPTGPESCELDLRYWGAPGSVLTDEALEERLRVQRDEDGTACERMQLALHSPRFSVGPLARDHERPISDFHANLARLLGSP